VTQHGARLASENGGHPASALGQEAGTDDCVDPAVDTREPTDLQSVIDCVTSKAKH